jgi:hypothetical protein
MIDGELIERTRSLAHRAEVDLGGSAAAAMCAAVVERLDGPLRVAIVGRVKAGKSTMLNALVRDRLAATDAGECTRILTEYRHSHVYDVHGVSASGRVPLAAERYDGGLRIEVPDDADLTRIEVDWPSSTLADITYIDTPGLASANDSLSALTESALVPNDRAQTEADAIVYLLRHVHERDQAFLTAFADRSVALGSPLNAVAVLSRADEIGAGRLDALVSVGRIAARLESDVRMRSLVSGVIPVIALLAESAATMNEYEVAALRRTAAELGGSSALELASVDRFRRSAASSLGAAERESLLARFGLFGLRWIVTTLHHAPDTATSTLVTALDQLSGVGVVRDHIRSVFVPRASILKVSTALAELRRIASSVMETHPDVTRNLLAGVERVEMSALEFTRLRVMHLATTGLVGIHPDDAAAAVRIARDPALVDRVVALGVIDRLRVRLEDPLLTGPAAELHQLTIRLHEARLTAG